MTATTDWQPYVLKDYTFAEFERHALVLDIGCGTGEQLEGARRRGCLVLGLDVHQPSLLECRRAGLPVIRGRAEQMPLRSGSVDGIICKGVLPLTDEPRVIREIARILKSGGLGYVAYLGAGYYLRYALVGRSWKHRFYGLRTLVNTWLYSLTARRLPGFLGDTVYQTSRRLARYYRLSRLTLLRNHRSPTFLGLPVFIYHNIQRAPSDVRDLRRPEP